MKITIDPVTRLEGNGRIEIILDGKGNPEKAYLLVPELRGFEEFCRGRLSEDMPILTARICGVCPEAHHFASVKALDDAYGAKVPEAALAVRELIYNAYIFADHLLHIYYLGGPDLIVGRDAPRAERNILGVIRKVGMDLGKEVVLHRSYGHRIIKMLGGRSINAVSALPGGVSKYPTEEEKKEIQDLSTKCRDFAMKTLDIFREHVLTSDTFLEMLNDEAHILRTYYMGIVDQDNRTNFYDGMIRVVDPEGREYAKVDSHGILDLIEEHVEPWSFIKIPYLKEVGWKGFVDGSDSGIYRVGPLGRLNVAESLSTVEADRAFREYHQEMGRVVHATMATHWARVIEMLNAAERIAEISTDMPEGEIRGELSSPGEGVGVIEAARGVLIHHYRLNEKGLVDDVNLIVATTNSYAGINMSIANAARRYIKGGQVDDGVLNAIEMLMRTYDPCLACATHVDARYPLVVTIRDHEGEEVRRLSNL